MTTGRASRHPDPGLARVSAASDHSGATLGGGPGVIALGVMMLAGAALGFLLGAWLVEALGPLGLVDSSSHTRRTPAMGHR